MTFRRFETNNSQFFIKFETLLFFFLESFENLKQQVAFYKDFITDPEKNLMRLNKDDKNQGNKACEEKLEWIETNYDIASLQQILDKTSELDSQFHSIIEKVNDTSKSKFIFDMKDVV